MTDLNTEGQQMYYFIFCTHVSNYNKESDVTLLISMLHRLESICDHLHLCNEL
jgi:hypothetical protein